MSTNKPPKKVNGSMISVKVNDNNVDAAIKVFRRKMKESGVLEEYKNRQFYIKPSAERRTKLNAAIRKQQKESATWKSQN